MTLARSLIAEIPALRRFSRALIGHAARADAYLEHALTYLLSKSAPSRLVSDGDAQNTRLELLKSLLSVISPRLDGSDPCDGCAMEKATQSILLRIPLRPRIAFLLRTLEELRDDDIADVMGVSPLQARLLVELGSASIASEMATRVLIIDGNASTANKLETIIEELGHSSCGKASSTDEARALTDRENPGLILAALSFLDGSSSIAILEELLKDHDIPVIIITEHPELWKSESGISPVGFITKPFLTDTVRATICKALFFKKRPQNPFSDSEKIQYISH